MAEPQAMAVTPPDVFVAEIRRLLAAGDRDGAVRELQRFRRTHVDADARLPEDLRDVRGDGAALVASLSSSSPDRRGQRGAGQVGAREPDALGRRDVAATRARRAATGASSARSA